MSSESAVFTLDIGGQSESGVEAANAIAEALQHLNETMTQVATASASSADSLGQMAGKNNEASEATDRTTESTSSMNSVMGEAQGALASVSGEMGTVVSVTGEMSAKLTEAIGGEGFGFAGLAGAAGLGIGAMVELGSSGANLATSISQVSAVTGLSIEETDFWGNALSDVGGSVNSLIMVNRLLTNSMESLNTAQSSGAPLTQKQSDLLQALGGNVMNAQGEVKSFAEAFPQLVQSLAGMTDETARAKAGTEIFGRSWAQVSLLIAEFPKVAAAAEQQTAKNAEAMKHANDIATDYHTSMHNLEVEYDALALRFIKPLTLTLNIAGKGFEFFDSDKSKTWAGQMDQFIGQEASGAFTKLAGAVDHYADSVGASLGVTSALADNTSLLGTNASLAANGAEAAASGIRAAGSAAGSAVPLVTAAAGAFGMLRAAMAGGAAIFQEVTTGENGLVLADINLIKSNKDKSDAMEKAYQALAASSDPTEHAIGQEHLDAEAKKATAEASRGLSAAQKVENETIPQLIQGYADQAAADEKRKIALYQYRQEMGIATDMEGNALPTMDELINRIEDQAIAEKRNAEATRIANQEMGIQTDINGKVIKSFQQLVDEQKSSILESQEMTKANTEANKELKDSGQLIDSTASSLDNLSSSLDKATLGWHQMTDAESQSSAKANASNSANTSSSKGSGGVALSSGKQTLDNSSFFSTGYGNALSNTTDASGQTIPSRVVQPGETMNQYLTRMGYDDSATGGYGLDKVGVNGYAQDAVANYFKQTGHYKNGLDYVPYDDFPAILHKGEKVVPANQVHHNNKRTTVHISRLTINGGRGGRDDLGLLLARLN